MGVPQARKPLKQAMARCALMVVMVLVLVMLLLMVLAVLLLQLLPLVEGGSCLLPAAGLAGCCLFAQSACIPRTVPQPNPSIFDYTSYSTLSVWAGWGPMPACEGRLPSCCCFVLRNACATHTHTHTLHTLSPHKQPPSPTPL